MSRMLGVRTWGMIFLWSALGLVSSSPSSAQDSAGDQELISEADPSRSVIEWHTRYSSAMEQAKDEGKMLFVFFHEAGEPDLSPFDRWLNDTQDGPTLAKTMVFCHVPRDLKVVTEGKEIELIDHPAFQHMEGRPGVAMIDYVDSEDPFHGRVVSVYPLTRQRQLHTSAIANLCRIPRGTLTQRSLVLAVCLHRDRPRSVTGRWNPILAEESQSHSLHQARIRVQGHHNWDSRFHRIIGRLGGSLGAQEVCAESWPGQPLMDAAEECVSSWRGSSGHWQAVSSPQESFAYDMKRGSNGVWYATGLFAR
ncbi:MAG: hypothetical protein KDA83_00520 [Planctomycetales bacterium]|nr:hypothetical protein [Planctomycetales bacterium]